MATEADPRGVMDDIIHTIKKGDAGRTSLHSSDPDPGVNGLKVTDEKPRELELIMDLLRHKEDRVAHDNMKFFLFREQGITSYVYLASIKAL